MTVLHVLGDKIPEMNIKAHLKEFIGLSSHNIQQPTRQTNALSPAPAAEERENLLKIDV